jgi:hypothetical protein
MMGANKLYRKEDIINMGSKVVNAGWGPRGADTYYLVHIMANFEN